MQWHKHEITKAKSTERNQTSNAQSCPFLNVVGASEFGLVMESKRDFETGATLSIGLHVDAFSECGQRASHFISAESIVVESHPEVAADGRLVYRITLLFSEISEKDRYRLLKASECFEQRSAPKEEHIGLN